MAQLLSNLPVGAKVKFGRYNGLGMVNTDLEWTIVVKNHTCTPAYPANAITLHMSKSLPPIAFDANEPTNTVTSYSTIGNCSYKVSNIRQWLNSRAAAGKWYTAQHSWDRPPSASYITSSDRAYDTAPGFLNAFTDAEYSAILDTTIRVAKSSPEGGGKEDLVDKVFLPSSTEVGFSNENNVAEGASWGRYSTSDDSLFVSGYDGKYGTWWLRTPKYSNNYVYRIDIEGGRSHTKPYGINGLCPVVNLPSTLRVSDTTDGDGCYSLIFNTAPTAPGTINVPTSVYAGKTLNISWGSSTDADGDSLTYRLERSTDGGVTYDPVYDGSDRSYTDVVYSGATVQYRVRAIDSNGGESEYTTSASRTVIYNQAPMISGTDSNLGVKTDGFTQTYSITDEDNDEVTVVEAIDGVQVRSYIVELGATNTFAVTDATWLKQHIGSHTMTITARDAFGNTTVRSYTFTKSVSAFSVGNTAPYEADTQPTRIKLSVTRNIPAGADFKVYVANNGFDTSPTWEDATQSVTGGLVHVFANKTKKAAAWGVLIKVEVARNGAEGACYVSQIGGNFE